VSAQEPRRPTPTERLYELAMAQAVRPPAAPEHSIDVSRNAKGDMQYAITVRGHDADEVADKAIELAERFEAKYPRANGGAT
jgi:hypothetical protein